MANPITFALEAAKLRAGAAIRAALTFGAAVLFTGILNAQSTHPGFPIATQQMGLR